MNRTIDRSVESRSRTLLRWLIGGASVVCLVAVVGWIGFRIWARSFIQPIVTEVWRRADEGQAIVSAIDKYIADSGRYPSYPMQDDQRFASYLDETPAQYWSLVTYDDRLALATGFSFVEWALEFDFSERIWKLNGEPLEAKPRVLPMFSLWGGMW